MSAEHGAHSPGPWRVADGGFDDRVLDASNALVAGACDTADGKRHTGPWANARLIAAAPELLEACEEALAALTTDEGQGIPGPRSFLRQVIAQARGEQP